MQITQDNTSSREVASNDVKNDGARKTRSGKYSLSQIENTKHNLEKNMIKSNSFNAEEEKIVLNSRSLSPTLSSTSTPRRKNILILHTNSSPRIIGSATPRMSTKVSAPISVENKRSSRIRQLSRSIEISIGSLHNSEEASANKVIVGLRRTQSSTIPLNTSPPTNSRTSRKLFLSPIDKLLVKNGSAATITDLDISPKVLLKDIKNSKRTKIIAERQTQQAGATGILKAKDTVMESENILPIKKQTAAKKRISNVAIAVNSHMLELTAVSRSVSVDSLQEVIYVEGSSIEEAKTPEVTNLQKRRPSRNPNMNCKDNEQQMTMDYSSNELGIFAESTEKSNKNKNESVCNAEVVQLEHTVAEPTSSMTLKSPSTISTDSAKGSSIVNETSWMTFSTGDLFWGQIYSYCFWPCMVCPDPDGKTITTEKNLHNDDQHVIVHVRFFADNGRRNWVKRENLIPYSGLNNYQERMQYAELKYGKKSAKYRSFVPKKSKVHTWKEAINEANTILTVLYPQRLEKFYEIYEESRVLQKLQRKRRQSMIMAPSQENTSDIGSLYDSTDNIFARQSKRDRSVSPFSPAYSPIRAPPKRRKFSNEEKLDPEYIETPKEKEPSTPSSTINEHNAVASTSAPLQDIEFLNKDEYKQFYAAMKDFVMGTNVDEKLERSLIVAVRNVWALKQINVRQMQDHLINSINENDLGSTLIEVGRGEGSIKRLSNRLKNIMMRRSVTPATVPIVKESDGLLGRDTQVVGKSKVPINRPITEVIEDIFNLDSKYLFKGVGREPICKYCYQPGGKLIRCGKGCLSWLHNDCIDSRQDDSKKKPSRRLRVSKAEVFVESASATDTAANDISIDSKQSTPRLAESPTKIHVTAESEEVVCRECAFGERPKCDVCKQHEYLQEELVFCNMAQCTKCFHPSCCRYWPQAKFIKSKNSIESFRCPSHVCHTCVSDDPKGKFQHLSNAKVTKCVKCPASYHMDSTCIPAGSEILTAAHIICPRHSSAKSEVNVNWCFICVTGGQVVCCETCPIAVHASCLNIPIDPNEGYICDECESGRMPLYGEMVWAKFNAFRWWPALILPPTEVPQNIMRKAHNPMDFVVRFFGTHDHGWISRRRVYLYLEGDTSAPPKLKSYLDQSYNRGVEEAKDIYEIIKSKKEEQQLQNESKEKLHPQPYSKIKTNRAVSPVKLHAHLEKVQKCECDPNSEGPCGLDSNCLNRVLYHECNPKLCPAGTRCENQMFESRISPRLDVAYMKERGFGLVCREPLTANTFVIEYVGEIINDDEFRQRMAQKSIDRDENFYFLSVEKDYIIDAGPKGNLARFMNHSCDPNCETQKWSVNGLNRVGLFTIKDIPTNTELTFNYHWDDLLGKEKKTCYCGAAKCAGLIGGKYKEDRGKDNGEAASKGKMVNSKNSKTLKRVRSKRAPKSKSQQIKVRGTSAKSVVTAKPKGKPTTDVKDSIGINATEDTDI